MISGKGIQADELDRLINSLNGDISDIKSEYDSHPHLGYGQLNIKEILQLLPNDAIITFETVKNSKSDLNDFVEDMLCLKSI